ncbi:uncharacterized protein BDZ83DRAFT_32848 [Colletotrichum acutatum]|uniref:Uncharacterized protein n=1 Tax=Glomerella acutata TaxID=27357 RepID=A0AAD8XL81_GLOAC|nr:uncharacterized protein BDZ83DRAFT_32848 [Colletotrichum acutatum]KAK1729467.1 hypothetical protein BDZ83DRAFT_32848 [Colletotrichum acutatum]
MLGVGARRVGGGLLLNGEWAALARTGREDVGRGSEMAEAATAETGKVVQFRVLGYLRYVVRYTEYLQKDPRRYDTTRLELEQQALHCYLPLGTTQKYLPSPLLDPRCLTVPTASCLLCGLLPQNPERLDKTGWMGWRGKRSDRVFRMAGERPGRRQRRESPKWTGGLPLGECGCVNEGDDALQVINKSFCASSSSSGALA